MIMIVTKVGKSSPLRAVPTVNNRNHRCNSITSALVPVSCGGATIAFVKRVHYSSYPATHCHFSLFINCPLYPGARDKLAKFGRQHITRSETVIAPARLGDCSLLPGRQLLSETLLCCPCTHYF
ncbi:hypothetical protein J6590_033348 [Homalodisca vitripennis]|nr:hypothetical protein J6590_033348 [Homalodisca vitripennis]